MIDAPGSVSTLILVVIKSNGEGGGELLLPEDKLAGLDVEARTAAARGTRTADARMDVQWGHPVDQLDQLGMTGIP